MPHEFRLTNRERDAMEVLWRRGSGTVSEVRERLAEDLAYTTVLWVMQTLEGKGFARHEKEGRAYRYFPTVAREAADANALSHFVDRVFHGSASRMLAQLVSERELPAAELERMRDLLDKRLEEGNGS